MKEAIALTNCPKVKVDARFLPSVTAETSGLSDVCISALPIPSREKDTSITPKLSPKIGRRSEITVMMSESNTVFLRPILFINMPVGTENIKNQKNTNDGNRLAVASFSWRSYFT